jgi:hypothetical protein
MSNEQVYEEVVSLLIVSHCPKVKRKQESRKHQNLSKSKIQKIFLQTSQRRDEDGNFYLINMVGGE